MRQVTARVISIACSENFFYLLGFGIGFPYFWVFFTHFTSVLTKWIVLKTVLVINNQPKGLEKNINDRNYQKACYYIFGWKIYHQNGKKCTFGKIFRWKGNIYSKFSIFFHFLSNQKQFISTFSVILIISTFCRPRGLVIGIKNRF